MIQLKKLEYGIDLKIGNEFKCLKFYVISGVFDKPARASILNIVNSTGFNSCLKCMQSGESIETDKGKVRLLFNI